MLNNFLEKFVFFEETAKTVLEGDHFGGAQVN